MALAFTISKCTHLMAPPLCSFASLSFNHDELFDCSFDPLITAYFQYPRVYASECRYFAIVVIRTKILLMLPLQSKGLWIRTKRPLWIFGINLITFLFKRPT